MLLSRKNGYICCSLSDLSSKTTELEQTKKLIYQEKEIKLKSTRQNTIYYHFFTYLSTSLCFFLLKRNFVY